MTTTIEARPPRSKTIPEFWPSVAEFLIYDDLLYFAMGRDTRRTTAYHQALKQHVAGRIVLDIGSGPEALLSMMSIDCGARHVYAIEYLDEPFRRSREEIHAKHLEDRISLIHGDARKVRLPERADVCVSGLVGSIGSLEGAVPILNEVRAYLLKSDAVMIPRRSITRIAAVELPENLKENPSFSDLTSMYVQKIFTEAGHPFDLRLCINKFPHSRLLTDAGIFEDLNFADTGRISYRPHLIDIEVCKAGRVHGFLLWLNLELAERVSIDILQDEHCLLPIYLDVFDEGIVVGPGDRILATCTTTTSGNALNPDYRIEGILCHGSQRTSFNVDSLHRSDKVGSTELYRALLNKS